MSLPRLANAMAALCACAGPAVCAARPGAELQARIDEAAAMGGGVVSVAAGDHMVASLRLKTGVTLHLDRGARLVASTNYSDYVFTPGEDRGAVVWADGAERIAIEGDGTVDGRGGAVPPIAGTPGRWRGIVLNRCRDARIEGIAVSNAHSWACYLKECDGVAVRRVKIFNHCNFNNDGLDIASKNVVVEDCEIESEDDALVFKNHNPDFVVENVKVRNCLLSCTSSFIKFGTETFGGFRDIDIRGCVLDTMSSPVCRPPFTDRPGVTTPQTGVAGIAVFVVDGGFAERITVSGVKMRRGVMVPVCVRLDRRTPRADGGETYLRDVLIENVEMEMPSTGWMSSFITGASGLRPRGVVLRDVVVRPLACGDASAVMAEVPERAGAFPGGAMFAGVLPASGFYVRHADDVRFENVKILPTGPDVRQKIVREE